MHFSSRHDFGMGRRILKLFALVVGLGDDLLAFQRDDHRPHRHFVFQLGQRGFFQRHPHVLEVERILGIAEREPVHHGSCLTR